MQATWCLLADIPDCTTFWKHSHGQMTVHTQWNCAFSLKEPGASVALPLDQVLFSTPTTFLRIVFWNRACYDQPPDRDMLSDFFLFLFLDIAQWVERKTWSCEAGLDTCVATRDVLWLLLVCAVCMTLFCNFSMDHGLFKRLHTKKIKNMKREYDILIWFETFCFITRVISVEFTLNMIVW